MINHIYELADDLDDGEAVDIQEDRGMVRFRLNPNLTVEQLIAALNTGSEAVLSGGHWFQEWHGDIISRRGSATSGRSIRKPRPTTHGMGEYGAS
mgnify:CR=1 FL=1